MKRANIKQSIRKSKDPVDRLYCSVADYLASKGGNAIMTGGIVIIDQGSESNFIVGVKCLGTKPDYTKKGST